MTDDFDEDLGEPVEELRDFEIERSPGFLTRLRGALRRRDLGSQMVTLSWSGFGTVGLEFIRMLFSFTEHDPPDRGGSD